MVAPVDGWLFWLNMLLLCFIGPNFFCQFHEFFQRNMATSFMGLWAMFYGPVLQWVDFPRTCQISPWVSIQHPWFCDMANFNETSGVRSFNRWCLVRIFFHHPTFQVSEWWHNSSSFYARLYCVPHSVLWLVDISLSLIHLLHSWFNPCFTSINHQKNNFVCFNHEWKQKPDFACLNHHECSQESLHLLKSQLDHGLTGIFPWIFSEKLWMFHGFS